MIPEKPGTVPGPEKPTEPSSWSAQQITSDSPKTVSPRFPVEHKGRAVAEPEGLTLTAITALDEMHGIGLREIYRHFGKVSAEPEIPVRLVEAWRQGTDSVKATGANVSLDSILIGSVMQMEEVLADLRTLWDEQESPSPEATSSGR